MKLLKKIMIVIALPLLIGCGEEKYFKGSGELESLYYHSYNSYSGMAISSTAPNELVTIKIPRIMDVAIIQDVPFGEKIWYEYEYTKFVNAVDRDYPHYINIHIHSVDDINTGGWSTTGKHPKSGTTTRIQ